MQNYNIIAKFVCSEPAQKIKCLVALTLNMQTSTSTPPKANTGKTPICNMGRHMSDLWKSNLSHVQEYIDPSTNLHHRDSRHSTCQPDQLTGFFKAQAPDKSHLRADHNINIDWILRNALLTCLNAKTSAEVVIQFH